MALLLVPVLSHYLLSMCLINPVSSPVIYPFCFIHYLTYLSLCFWLCPCEFKECTSYHSWCLYLCYSNYLISFGCFTPCLLSTAHSEAHTCFINSGLVVLQFPQFWAVWAVFINTPASFNLYNALKENKETLSLQPIFLYYGNTWLTPY